MFKYCCFGPLLLLKGRVQVDHPQLLQVPQTQQILQACTLQLPQRPIHVLLVVLDLRKQFLRVLDPDRSGLVLLLVREHADVALALHLALSAHDGSQAERPGFALLELVAGTLAQLLLGEPEGLLVVQSLAVHAVSADVGDGQHALVLALVLALLTLDHLDHGLGHVVAACVDSHVLDSCGDGLLGGEDQVGLLGVLTKGESVCSDVAVPVGGELDGASVALGLLQPGVLVQDVIGNDVIQVEA